MNHTDVHEVFNARRQNGDVRENGREIECAVGLLFFTLRDNLRAHNKMGVEKLRPFVRLV
jgi:hypothetical protein